MITSPKAGHLDITFPKAIIYGWVNILWRIHCNYRLIFIMFSVFISYYVCRSPSYTPKTNLNGRPAAVLLKILVLNSIHFKSIPPDAKMVGRLFALHKLSYLQTTNGILLRVHMFLFHLRITFIPVNLVELQKLNRTAATQPTGWVFGVQLVFKLTQ